MLLIKRYQEPPHRQSLGVLEQPGALIKKTHCEPPQAAPMGVLEQNKVFKKTGLVAERFKAVVLKTIIGIPYREFESRIALNVVSHAYQKIS